MKKPLAVISLLLASANAAFASGDVYCRTSDEKVSVSILVSHSETLNVLRTIITIGDETWSSDASVQPGIPILAGQAYENDGMLLIDFIGEAAGPVVARLKAFSADGEGDYVSGGVFTFTGKGAFVVDCSDRG